VRRRGIGTLRFRIALVFIAAGLLVSGLVAGSTYAFARTFLTRQRTDAAVRTSFNSLRFAAEYVARPQSDRSLGQLVSFLQSRGTSDVLVVSGDTSVTSSVSITQRAIPVSLRMAVTGGRVGYVVFGTSNGPRRLAFGSPVPNSPLDAYLVYSLQDLDETLGLLARILFGVVAGALVISAGLGFRVAGRTIQPLSRASEAAQRVAEGLLETRLEESGRDELGMLAASFNTMAEALQDRIARERRFVADASHELRTPLTALKTSVEFLAERKGELPARLGSAAELAADEVRSLQRLVDDLLELTRVEAGGVHVIVEDIDLGAFAGEVVRRRAPGVDVEVSAPAGFVVRTDKGRLERVVGNLIENAVVHGEGNDVRLSVERHDAHARILVSDAGPGIDPEQVHRVFERFWRADVSRRRGGLAGAGLGLAIARESANVIGAELEVRSEPGNGTTIIVLLPVDPPETWR
jgi:signal transduction histidine kinase